MNRWNEATKEHVSNMILSGRSRQFMADALGLTKPTFDGRLSMNGLSGLLRPRIDWDEIGDSVRAMMETHHRSHVAKHFGISEGGITYYLQRNPTKKLDMTATVKKKLAILVPTMTITISHDIATTQAVRNACSSLNRRGGEYRCKGVDGGTQVFCRRLPTRKEKPLHKPETAAKKAIIANAVPVSIVARKLKDRMMLLKIGEYLPVETQNKRERYSARNLATRINGETGRRFAIIQNPRGFNIYRIDNGQPNPA